MTPAFRVLVVEDSQTQALALEELLAGEGWHTACAPAAAAALEQIAAAMPDLVVVDRHLPGISGDEFCRQLRMNLDTRGIPILMLTVDETEASELRALESGADDYLHKSVDREILLLRIRNLLRKSRVKDTILGRSEAYSRRARLLAIDDSPTYLAYLVEELRGECYSVEQAPGGLAGLERLAAEPFDCVLVDLLMPDLDGIEVCRRIADMRRAMDNPIVVLMLTAHEGKDDMTRGLEAGADDFVGKSSDMAVLKARIRALLRRKFFQEENRRILEELKTKELEAVRARAEKEAAEARAVLAEQLAATNRQLQEANERLKDAQAQLVHSEKMASLGQLVAGIAHEINNPMAYVLNNLFTVERGTEQLERELGEAGRPAAMELLARNSQRLAAMREGLERVAGLVTGLRTFSRLDCGDFGVIDVHESIESVLRFLRHRMEGRIQVVLNFTTNGTLGCFAGQLNQVLMNLLANAVDAIEGPGTITVSTVRRDGMLEISVKDTGKGIAEQIRHRIFEPFFTTKPPGKGIGLGLSIAYGVVENHRGSIAVASEERHGTEFTVRIPLDLEERMEHEATGQQTAGAGAR